MKNTEQTAATRAYDYLYEQTAVFLANYDLNMTENQKQQTLIDRSEYFKANVDLCETHGLDEALLEHLMNDGLLADFMITHFRWTWDKDLNKNVQKRITL